MKSTFVTTNLQNTRNLFAILVGGLLISGCANDTSREMSRAVSQTSGQLDNAVMTPFGDLNLIREPIPDLLAAIRSPYEPVKGNSCADIAAAVSALTDVLGPDHDLPAQNEDDSLARKAGDSASKLAINSVTSTVTGFIPYRSLLRSASGASAHERAFRQAYADGAQRRAYLKGIGASMGCAPPAAPEPNAGLGASEPPKQINFR